MHLEPPRLKKFFVKAVEDIVGPGGYSFNSLDRINYSRDSSFRSVIGQKFNKLENPPDMIAWPTSVEEVRRLILLAIRHLVPIVPFGAGSGVCGGAMPVCGGMVIDCKKMRKILWIDESSLEVKVETGIMGLHLENELARRGYTLGHFPSSILCASLGGYLAARSAGQNSSRYGKIEDMVKKLEGVTGRGDIFETEETENGKGIDLNQIFLGSEGTLGIITKTVLKIYPTPPSQAFSAFRFHGLQTGIEAMRRLMQSGLKPTVVRLYDSLDSLISGTYGEEKKRFAVPGLLKPFADLIQSHSMKMLLAWPRMVEGLSHLLARGPLLILVHEGHERLAACEQKIAHSICRDLGGVDLGEDPARYWLEHRYSVSYKASPLFYSGAFTDTIEVATTWDKIYRLYASVKKALLPHTLVMAHISHAYTEGGSIYFTFVSPLSNLAQSEALYDLIWDKALRACQKVGGVISHHHGIGRLKAKYMGDEWGEGIELFCRLKDFFDPYRIMNPGKLVFLKKAKKDIAA